MIPLVTYLREEAVDCKDDQLEVWERYTEAADQLEKAVNALRYIAGYDIAGYEAHMLSDEVAAKVLIELGDPDVHA